MYYGRKSVTRGTRTDYQQHNTNRCGTTRHGEALRKFATHRWNERCSVRKFCRDVLRRKASEHGLITNFQHTTQRSFAQSLLRFDGVCD